MSRDLTLTLDFPEQIMSGRVLVLELPQVKRPLHELYRWAESQGQESWVRIEDGPNAYDYFEIRGKEIGCHPFANEIIQQFPELPLNENRTALHKMAPSSFVPIHIDHAFEGAPRKSVLIVPFQVPCDGVRYYSEDGSKRISEFHYHGPVIITADTPHDVENRLDFHRYSIQFSLDDAVEAFLGMPSVKVLQPINHLGTVL